jgi:glutaminase
VRSVVQDYVDSILGGCVVNRSGAVADYIPELAAADPDAFGICIASADGHVYEAGDTRVPFTIQSISKPFTYGLALSDRGIAAVDAKVGVEPSGDAFNEISLDPVSGRPRNAMINAGAITAASLVAGDAEPERFERIRATYSRYAGRELELDQAVYESERRTGHRNRAIGYMLRTVSILEEDPEPVVDRYFRQCSLRVDARDLALMAATLANNGIQPLTGERALAPELVERVLSVMTTCGMYDGAGDWVSGVGLPAKSGVGGGVLAVLPGQVGLAVYSPRLDEHGNSVRGVEACRRLSRELELHFLHVSRGARSAVRASWDLADRPSRRRRTAEEERVLREHGRRARIYALHGDLRFAGAETVVREIVRRSDDLDLLVLDLRRVDEVAGVARRMLAELRTRLRESGCEVTIVDPDGVLPEPPAAAGGADPVAAAEAWPPRFASLDHAVEWCEDELLLRHGTPACRLDRVELAEHPLLAGRDPAEVERLRRWLVPRTAVAGERLVRRGDPPAGIFLILSGQVTVSVDGPDGRPRRIATLAAGMSFGELALIARRPHAADVVADGPVELLVLEPAAFDALGREAPAAKLALIEALVTRAFETDDRAARALATRTAVGAAR